MSDLKRYFAYGAMGQGEHGPYVLSADYDRLAAQNAALRKLAERSKSLLPNWVIPSFNADLRRALTPAAQENATRKESEL